MQPPTSGLTRKLAGIPVGPAAVQCATFTCFGKVANATRDAPAHACPEVCAVVVLTRRGRRQNKLLLRFYSLSFFVCFLLPFQRCYAKAGNKFSTNRVVNLLGAVRSGRCTTGSPSFSLPSFSYLNILHSKCFDVMFIFLFPYYFPAALCIYICICRPNQARPAKLPRTSYVYSMF